MAGLMAILAFFTHELAIEEKRLIAVELLEQYKKSQKLHVDISQLLLVDDVSSVPVLENSRCASKILSLAYAARRLLDRKGPGRAAETQSKTSLIAGSRPT
jgi:hypothetical protein